MNAGGRDRRGRDNDKGDGVIRCLAIATIVFAFHAPACIAGKFLPHKTGMTVPEKVAYFKRSVRHERQVVDWLESRQAPRTLERVSELGWYRAAVRWHTTLLAQYQAKLVPPVRTYAGPCLASIIDSEGSGWNPERWNGGTVEKAVVDAFGHLLFIHGSGAYGLPQALPANKMSSAGADWATDPYTQIRWAHQYAVERYGSDCAAWAHWQAVQSW